MAFPPPKTLVFNRPPLRPAPFAALPLGAARPRGWLLTQLRRMADGMAGRLDEAYPLVGSRNGWLGGDGDSWERGPYWLDGLVPLAHLLGDAALIEKARPWIEWTLNSQQADGSFGPREGGGTDAPDPGVQRGNKGDWWPRMVMLKVLISHQEATGDPRVLPFLASYFRFQLATLPEKPLGHWTHWGKERGGENLAAVHWLYNRTGEPWLIDLARILVEQTSDWTAGFWNGEPPSTHGVNIAMALKEPALAYLQTGDAGRRDAPERGLAWLMKRHGQPQGMFGADELLHGRDPTQGTELCTIVELMLSLEELIRITGRREYADHLEKIAFNALPAQVTPDWTARQYYQQPNQVRVSRTEARNFNTRYQGTDTLFGLLTGFPCCTTNMHQGWPKLVKNLWLATPGGGLAAAVYAPCEVETPLGPGNPVRIIEETDYPFGETVRFSFSGPAPARFPLTLRIPAWCANPRLRVNGEEAMVPAGVPFHSIDRPWREGDVVELDLPMEVRLSRWHENSVAVERGPLVFALPIREEWKKIEGPEPFATFEVHPQGPWNYGLIVDEKAPGDSFRAATRPPGDSPFTPENAPATLCARARRIPHWREYNESAGPLPWSPVPTKEPVEEVTLIPYACARLRISEFPVVVEK